MLCRADAHHYRFTAPFLYDSAFNATRYFLYWSRPFARVSLSPPLSPAGRCGEQAKPRRHCRAIASHGALVSAMLLRSQDTSPTTPQCTGHFRHADVCRFPHKERRDSSFIWLSASTETSFIQPMPPLTRRQFEILMRASLENAYDFHHFNEYWPIHGHISILIHIIEHYAYLFPKLL